MVSQIDRDESRGNGQEPRSVANLLACSVGAAFSALPSSASKDLENAQANEHFGMTERPPLADMRRILTPCDAAAEFIPTD